MTEARPPFHRSTFDSARAKVQAAEDAWNSRDPHRVSLAYTPDSICDTRMILTECNRMVSGTRSRAVRLPRQERGGEARKSLGTGER